MRYEDLVADPAPVLRRIAGFAGAAPEVPLPFTADGLLSLAPTHSVAGNPVRHRTGGVPVTADDEWRHAMPRRSRLLVTALTAPLLSRLGYPFGRQDAMTLAVVAGTGRCGSTLVQELLCRHPATGFVSGLDDKLPKLNLTGRWNGRALPGRRAAAVRDDLAAAQPDAAGAGPAAGGAVGGVPTARPARHRRLQPAGAGTCWAAT